jgi:hypothetical protein
MSTNLTFSPGALSCQTRFVLVNGRVPRTDQHCALCGGIIEKSYVRDSQTRLIYCDTQCFAGGARITMSGIKHTERKAVPKPQQKRSATSYFEWLSLQRIEKPQQRRSSVSVPASRQGIYL